MRCLFPLAAMLASLSPAASLTVVSAANYRGGMVAVESGVVPPLELAVAVPRKLTVMVECAASLVVMVRVPLRSTGNTRWARTH